MSSNIERSVLKDLWNEVNRTIPGTLTRNELICLLALIGLIQVTNIINRGSPFNMGVAVA